METEVSNVKKQILSLVLSLLLFLPLLVSCAETPANTPDATADGTDSRGSESAVEPVSEPETDPFESADPLPDDLSVPSCLKTKDGAALGTIVLPKAAETDPILAFAAEDLQYHLKKVLGADFAIVSRPGEGYGSMILATPATLPAITEMFADDIAWLADLGSRETGRWGSDGFAIRQVGDDIWIIGNTSKGAMNGIYDLIEDNLGVLWFRADESIGLIYDAMEEASIVKTDYREKSPFEYRGFHLGSEWTNALMVSRNKANTTGYVEKLGTNSQGAGHTIINLLTSSPLYDPEEPEYWETDENGTCLWREGSNQINIWSKKAADAIAASVIARMQDTGVRSVFIGEEDCRNGRVVPHDTEPFEYAPGQFVSPEDRNFRSTVFFSMINDIARQVKEAVPDGWIETFALESTCAVPSCDLEDNIKICFCPSFQEYTMSIFDQSVKEKIKPGFSSETPYNGEDLTGWAGIVDHISLWQYYLCDAHGADFCWPTWYLIQEDMQGYAKLGIEGVTTDGLPDLDQVYGWTTRHSAYGTGSNYWDMSGMLCWIFEKLLWDPYEDIPSLISYFCDKVYGDASPYMQEYYRLTEEGFRNGAAEYHKNTGISIHVDEYYKVFVKNPGIGHPVLDTLEEAYNAAAEGWAKDNIKYIRDRYWFRLSSFKNF